MPFASAPSAFETCSVVEKLPSAAISIAPAAAPPTFETSAASRPHFVSKPLRAEEVAPVLGRQSAAKEPNTT
ncbi:hypothetical protein IC744_10250 [Microbacterium hominis]|uniref:hypothetical protein n=1 Tax=Microbacterium hominis TaxID=162426 RepID=UPI00168AFE60|nr:hypothetical protein [Microbacterium hominis]QOC27852.1 hypothetical protein IC744_10250 [Microbacterium hominis]